MPEPDKTKASQKSGARTGCPWQMMGALGLLGGLLVYHQFTALDRIRFTQIPPGRSYTSFGLYWKVLSSTVSFTVGDYLSTGAIALLFLGIVAMEVRGGSFTRFLNWTIASQRRQIAFLSVSFLFLVRFYFALGEAWSADAAPHMAHVFIAARSFGNWGSWRLRVDH